MIVDLLLNRCPSCRKGEVFTGLYRMNAVCPNCSTKFEREQGYYLGALVVAYVMSAISMIPTVVYLVMVADAGILTVILVPSLQIALLNPLFFMYSRLIWIYLDRGVNPKSWN